MNSFVAVGGLPCPNRPHNCSQLTKYSLRGSDGCDALEVGIGGKFPGPCYRDWDRRRTVRVKIGFYPLDKVRLFYGLWQSPLRLQMFNSRYFMQSFPIRGISETVNNGVARTASPSEGALFEPGAITFSPMPDFEHNVVLFDPETLLRTISTLTGSPVNRPLKLDRAKFRRAARGAIVARPRQAAGRGTGRRKIDPFAGGGCGTRTGDVGGFSLRRQPQLQPRSRWSAARARRRGKFDAWRNMSKRTGISPYPWRRSPSLRTRARAAYFIRSNSTGVTRR